MEGGKMSPSTPNLSPRAWKFRKPGDKTRGNSTGRTEILDIAST